MDLASLRSALIGVPFLPENFRLHGWLKGSELVNFHARLAGLDYRSAKRSSQAALELVGLAKEGEKTCG
ncbi:MAG: hypothetical protein KGZ92_04075 [Firmicutes bacterium]|nr:hypothetical protein [Dethiobacter sp.]MBS3888465.1 hypothetical protein [Bacillota bacterium]